MKTVAESGILAEDIAVSAYRAFAQSLNNTDDAGQQLPEWERLSEVIQDFWLRVAQVAIAMIEEAQELRWVDLAAELFRALAKPQCEAAGVDVPVFQGQNARARFAWEATARHLANLIDAEPGDIGGLDELERKWRGWADIKAEKEKQ
jgi:hypothetical protein